MTIETIPYDEYDQRDAVRASVLFQSSWRQVQWVQDGNSPVSDDAVRVGSAAHSVIEYLGRFDDHFVVMPDFSRSPDNVTDSGKPSKSRATNWCKGQEEAFRQNEAREVLTHTEYLRLSRIVRSISECPEAMRLIGNTEHDQKEVSFFATIEGVNCKARVDGVPRGVYDGCSCWWNLKTTADITRFHWQVRNLKYLEKDAFHLMVMKANNVYPDELCYIVAEDCRPSEGVFRRAPECCVFTVPVVAFENYFPAIRNRLIDYSACVAGDCWPMHEGGPLQIPDMPEVTLVD